MKPTDPRSDTAAKTTATNGDEPAKDKEQTGAVPTKDKEQTGAAPVRGEDKSTATVKPDQAARTEASKQADVKAEPTTSAAAKATAPVTAAPARPEEKAAVRPAAPVEEKKSAIAPKAEKRGSAAPAAEDSALGAPKDDAKARGVAPRLEERPGVAAPKAEEQAGPALVPGAGKKRVIPEQEGRARVIIENVRPCVDCGRFAIKRTVGETVVVEADAFTDGHDMIRCLLLYRKETASEWIELPMTALGNDGWRASFVVSELGRYVYTVTAWVDHFLTWRYDLGRRTDVADIALALRIGSALVKEAAERASGAARTQLEEHAQVLARATPEEGKRIGADPLLGELMGRYPDRRLATTCAPALPVHVDRERARFSTWYELFPRSCVSEGGKHGTFESCEKRLPYVAQMGFDVLYLPPIHPIGATFRKGKNNALVAQPDDVGSPWAIGAADGGHKAVHRELGTLESFRRFMAKARELGIEIAMDIAFQCAPDHPYVKQHPTWFRWRPDGTVQYAENPPKKYQDIYPFDFESEDWEPLWEELRSVFLFWIEQGVRIFRVDNPHTKPFAMWEWLIGSVQREHPDTIFLAEAFTRPKIMHRLAKLGYTQSYTYFAWRNTKQELTDYFTELTQSHAREYFRPNLWPNTPDILTEFLQFGGRPAFMLRVALAATLGASYGIYGPAYELLEHVPRDPGSEEYLHSEKYQIRVWDLKRPESLREYVTLLNRIRKENPALQSDWSLRFHRAENDAMLCYSKSTEDSSNVIVVVANLDPHHVQSGWVELDLEPLELESAKPYQVHDLLSGAHYLWQGRRNFVQLDPKSSPVHVFRVRRKVRTERDFDYFL
jgi:starch synthase (maltosyl-transferring)